MSDSKPVTETVTKIDKREHNIGLKSNSELKQSLLALDSEYTSISDSNNFPRHKHSLTQQLSLAAHLNINPFLKLNVSLNQKLLASSLKINLFLNLTIQILCFLSIKLIIILLNPI